MYIELIECPKCGHKARPGELGFQLAYLQDRNTHQITCKCGNVFEVITSRDQLILSNNTFVRLEEASNHIERGIIKLTPGTVEEVRFKRQFDFACRAFLGSQNVPLYIRELSLNKDKLVILSSYPKDKKSVPGNATITWSVFGLVNIDILPPWYVHFYGAISQLVNGLYNVALIDYAVAFEIFMENFLVRKLKDRFGVDATEYILKKTWRIEDRCKDLLYLATGHKLSERDDVYQAWNSFVRKPRNDLAHGKSLKVDNQAAEDAHQATYQAIRWVENVAGQCT